MRPDEEVKALRLSILDAISSYRDGSRADAILDEVLLSRSKRLLSLMLNAELEDVDGDSIDLLSMRVIGWLHLSRGSAYRELSASPGRDGVETLKSRANHEDLLAHAIFSSMSVFGMDSPSIVPNEQFDELLGSTPRNLTERLESSAHLLSLFGGADADHEWALASAVLLVLAVESLETTYDDPARIAYNCAYSLGLLSDFESNETMSMRSLNLLRFAVAERPSDSKYVAGLADALRLSYELTGQLHDLEEAISVCRESIALAPSSLDWKIEINLAGLLDLRCTALGDNTSRNEGIEILRRVCDRPDLIPADRAMACANLADLELSAHEHGGGAQHIQAAIQHARDGMAVADPEDSVLIGGLYATLSRALRTQARAEGGVDVQQTIDAARRSIASTPPDHRYYSHRLSVLAESLRQRHRATGDRAALEEAITAACASCAAARPDEVAARRGLVAALKVDRYLLDEDDEDLEGAITEFQSAANSAYGRVSLAAEYRWQAAELMVRSDQWTRAYPEYRELIGLLPILASRRIDMPDREVQLARFGNLASLAAESAVRAEGPAEALTLVESARNILLSQRLEDAHGLQSLMGEHSDLGARLDDLARQLDGDGGERLDSKPRTELLTRWHETIDEIRASPGFENFLRGTGPLSPESDLEAGGPVVVLYGSQGRFRAIIADGSQRDVVTFDRFDLEGLERAIGPMFDALYEHGRDGHSSASESAVFDALEWIWDVIAEPVLRALGIEGRRAESEQRVWWIPIGLLSFFPIHAAGYHRPERTVRSRDTVLDRTVPSYATSIRTLTESPPVAPPDGLLVVGMAETPGGQSLPAVVTEVEQLRSVFPRATVLSGESATVDNVRQGLGDHAWVHFAGHAEYDYRNPRSSGLVLSDGLLTVDMIAEVRRRRYGSAFLSGCSTGLRGLIIPDEALGIGDSFSIAGFNNVVSTMWPVVDEVSSLVSTAFYERVLRARLEPAAALRDAVLEMRSRFPHFASLWAPFANSGR